MSAELFAQAGVYPGHRAWWTLPGCAGFCGPQTHEVVVLGLHFSVNAHLPAIEVYDPKQDHAFRAFPEELRAKEAA